LKKIVLIGSGNLAWHLGSALKKAGNHILQVYSRDLKNATELANHLNTFDLSENLYSSPVHNLNLLSREADLYFLLVPDVLLLDNLFLDSMKKILNPNPEYPKNKAIPFFIHSSGSTSINVLERLGSKIGVLYPLQSFSKSFELDFDKIPLLIETKNTGDFTILAELSGTLSEFIYEMDSDKRAICHLSAIFANNFTNRLLGISEEILQKSDISFQILFPIIAETVRKVFTIGPQKAQTGPALRKDKTTQDFHLGLLENEPDLQKIYRDLSDSIQKNKSEPKLKESNS
jgi:hypothetical protein